MELHLVMIHGLLGSLDYFSPERHIDRATVHAPHLPGYGEPRDRADPLKLSLRGQAQYVRAYISERIGEPCWILGHSVGGAIAKMLAADHPELVRGIIDVEGNFTLSDAFWCGRVAAMTRAAWEVEYDSMCGDAERWLADSGVTPTPERVGLARRVLAHQPAATVHAVASAVVRETGQAAYDTQIRRVIDAGVPIHLVAGERSAEGWDVPLHVRSAAASYTLQRGAGHMMMLEDPAEFCRIVSRIVA